METFTASSQGLSYRVWQPVAPYDRLFRIVLEVRGTPAFAFERVLPRLGAEVIFNLGGDMTGRFPANAARIGSGDFTIKGVQLGVFDSYLEADAHFLIARLTTAGFRELIALPASELSNTHLANYPVGGLPKVAQRVQEAPSFRERVAVLQRWACRQVRDVQPDPLTRFLERTLGEYPQYDGRTLEKRTGYTAKYLNRRFRQQTGYTLSAFRRLRRFQQALEHIKTAESAGWTDIAYAHHFYDQSHFIRECRAFTGLTPTALRAQLGKAHFNLPF